VLMSRLSWAARSVPIIELVGAVRTGRVRGNDSAVEVALVGAAALDRRS
jgi:hypothetical protein